MAEGEQSASRALKEAADVIASSPAALQLRYMQTLTGISSEKNSTIVFPLPIELMRAFVGKAFAEPKNEPFSTTTANIGSSDSYTVPLIDDI